MKSSAKAPSTLRYLLITFIGLLIFLGYYWFSYIPSREGYFTNRNLRLLSDMSENITKIVESYKGQIDKNFINRDKSIFQMVIEQGNIASADRFQELQTNDCLQKGFMEDFMQNQVKRIRHLSYENGRVCLGTERYDTSYDKHSRIKYNLELKNNGYVIRMDYQGRRLPREETKMNDPDTYAYTVDLQTSASLKDIMAPFLKPDIFDNILLIEHAEGEDDISRVVYQADQTAFRASRLDSLTSTLKETWSSYHDEVIWGNSAYKLFVQPVRLALLGQETNGNTEVLEWMLVGLVDANRLNADAREISRFSISQWTFIFFLVLFSIPLIKLNFIGEREELKRSDIILTVFSIFVLSGILTFWLLSYYSDRNDIEELDYGLKPLAQQIEKNLYTEVESAIRQFYDLNQKFTVNRQQENEKIETLNKDRKNKADYIPETGYTIPEIFSTDRLIYDTTEVNALPYPYFEFFAWIDSTGLQTRKLSTLQEVTPLVNVGHRKYFRNIMNGQCWTLNDQPFYIEPIISITTGENIAVLSIPDTVSSEPVNMMTLNFMSVVNPVLPRGIGYCIVDQNGLVLFHSEQQKNMQENFFVECNDPAALRAAVFSKVEKTLTVDYLGREHYLHLKPFDHIPEWTLITFGDLWRVRSSELNAISSALALYTIMVLSFLMVLLFYLFFRYYNILDWFWPKAENDHKYRYYSIALLALAGVYYRTIFNLGSDVNLLMAVALPAITAIITAYYFQRPHRITGSEINNDSQYQKESLIDRYLRLTFIVLVAILMILLVVFTGFQFLIYGLFGLLVGLFLNHEPVTTWYSTKKLPNYYARFALSGVAFFLMTSVLPAIALFKISYDAEKEVLVKSGQHSLYLGMQTRKKNIRAALNDRVLSPSNREEITRKRSAINDKLDIYADFFFNTFLSKAMTISRASMPRNNVFKLPAPASVLLEPGSEEATIKTVSSTLPPTKASNADEILGFLRGQTRIVDYRNWELHQEKAVENPWNWQRWLMRRNSLLLFNGRDNGEAKGLCIASAFVPLVPPDSLFWGLGMLVLFILLYVLMSNFIYQVFGISLSIPMTRNEHRAPLTTINQNTIYIGQPNSGKSKVIQRIQDNFHIIDLRDFSTPEELNDQVENALQAVKDCKVIILDHFDLRFDELEWNYALLQLLEHLISGHRKVLLLIATIDPALIMPRLMKKSKNNEEEITPDQPEKRSGISVDKNYLNRWTMILSSFAKVYHRIYTDDAAFLAEVEKIHPGFQQSKSKENPMVKILVEECRHTSFLQHVGLDILTKYDLQKDFINEEILIDEILLRSEAYYESIWATCSIDEKITLIHLARNNFVPEKDARIVRLLMRKGLVSSNQYRLLNKSFADFVMNAESSAVIKNWKRNQENTWDNIRTPLITIVLVVVAFIFVTQRQLFNVSIAWITTFAALIPAFLRVLSMARPKFSFGRKTAAVSEELLGD